jgi:uncharacterized cupredoxin-like copper-binding protein
MQLIDTMKMAKIIPIAILCLMVSATLVSATHTSSVTITPNTWAKNTDKSVSIVVTNTNGDSITKVELNVPKDTNQVPIYTVGDITRPEGWTYQVTGTPISKITWIATGSGIASGSSLSLFGIDVKSPSVSGDFKWNWVTKDSKDGTYNGFAVTTAGQAPVSYFVISGVPTTSIAGTSFKINVKAYGDDNQIKKDYTGKITFTLTDPYATLPLDYNFQTTDYGSKDFTITYKGAGDQKLTVKDVSAGISQESSKTVVKPGPATDIGIMPQDKKVSAGEKVEFKITAKDSFGNLFDVTDKTTITIDKKAGGSWNKSIYTTQNEGIWVVIASYNSIVSGTTLTVGKGAVVPPVTPPVTPPTNVTPEVPEMSLSVPESTAIAPGANDTMIITVNNNGDKDITGVEIKVEGIPSDWVSIYPLLNDIPSKSSKDYLVIVFVPGNESGTKEINFIAKSSEGVTAEKNTSLVISGAPTGIFAMPKNILQLGVVIIAVAAVVIIGWELWFKKPKPK